MMRSLVGLPLKKAKKRTRHACLARPETACLGKGSALALKIIACLRLNSFGRFEKKTTIVDGGGCFNYVDFVSFHMYARFTD